MSRSTFDVREEYIGAGNLDAYSFDFKIENLDQILVTVFDDDGVLVGDFRGDDATFLASVDFDPIDGGGTVNLLADLAAGWKIVILLADDEPTQPFEFKNKFDFTLKKIEQAFDWLSGQIQRLAYLQGRNIRLSDRMSEAEAAAFDKTLPFDLEDNPGATLAVNEDGDGFAFGPTTDEINLAVVAAEAAQAFAESAASSADASAASAAASAASAGVPPGGGLGAALVKNSLVDADTRWEDTIYSGISALTGGAFSSAGLKDTLDKIIRITYTPPQISLVAAGSTTVREKGTAVTSVLLTATTTKRSNDIGAVRFYKDGVLIHTVPVPMASGGAETYTWTGSFSDNTTFSAEVDDVLVGSDQTIGVSSSRSFVYVYPYYVGAGASALAAAAVAALTKLTQVSTATVNRTITAGSGNVFYFAYPASYGALTSILDVNNFETIGDWTLRTENITGLDASAVSYRIYEFNNPVVAGDYFYSFRR